MIELDQVETLRQQAIGLLVTMRQEINGRLAQLGYQEGEPIKSTIEVKKDRKPKTCSLCHQPGHIAKTCKATQVATTE